MNVSEIYECERHFHCYRTALQEIRWRPLLDLKAVRAVAGMKSTRRYESHIGELDYIFWDTHRCGEAQIKQAFSQLLFDQLPEIKTS